METSRQIGRTVKQKLLYRIYNQLKFANGLAYEWTQGDFFQQGSLLNQNLYAIATDSEDGTVETITTDSEDGTIELILIDTEDR